MAASTDRRARPDPVAASQPATASEPGILHPTLAAQRFDYRRHVPDERLAPFVENIWTITWDLRGQEPFTAHVLPYPSVNASVTNEQADVTGLVRRRYDRHLAGQGYVVGARFRPGCFRPWTKVSVSTFTDTGRPIADVLGRDTVELQRAVADTCDRMERVALFTAYLIQDLPAPDPVANRLAQLVDEIAVRPDLTRVDQVATLADVSVRRLQRLFVDYVGAGPKWVITRCRLQDAAVRAAADAAPDWASLAAELGFADQAHLTRAFSQIVGTPPAAYAARARSGKA